PRWISVRASSDDDARVRVREPGPGIPSRTRRSEQRVRSESFYSCGFRRRRGAHRSQARAPRSRAELPSTTTSDDDTLSCFRGTARGTGPRRADALAGGDVGVSARIAVERARTAYHEAGHLLIGSLFGFLCSSVSIRPDEAGGSLGRVVPLEGPESWSYRIDRGGQPIIEMRRQIVEQWVWVLFAGFAAEVRFAPDFRDAAREGAWGDDEQAQDYLERAGMANESTQHLLRAHTAELIEQHWSGVEYVARALLRHEEFDSREAECICEIARGEATESDLEIHRARRAAP